MEGALRAPDVEMASQVLEAGLDTDTYPLGSPAADRPGGILARMFGLFQDGGGQLPGHVVDVVAAIAVLGDLLLAPDRHDRGTEVLDLAAEVVEVVLPLDGVTGRRQDAAQQVAGEGAAGIADVERPGGVGRDELDVDALGVLGGHVTPAGGVGQDAGRGCGEGRVGYADVQETRRRHFHGRYGRGRVRSRRGDVRGDGLRELEGRAAVVPGHPEGHVAGEIAVGSVRGTLDNNRRLLGFGRSGQVGLSTLPGRFDGVTDLRSQAGRSGWGHGANGSGCDRLTPLPGLKRRCLVGGRSTFGAGHLAPSPRDLPGSRPRSRV
jgi:hypothetical protein